MADAVAADVLLVTARDPDDNLGVFATTDAQTSAEPSRRRVAQGRSRATSAAHAARRIELDNPSVAIAHALDRLGVAAAVDGVGAAQRALELAVEYAKERVQFDKPIGAFQAVQHLCADMLRTVELGRAAAYYACWALDDASPEEAHRAATLARAFAADAFPQLGGTAIQVFGGIGFTWEHDIHLFYKRLLSCSLALGTSSDHLAELARSRSIDSPVLQLEHRRSRRLTRDVQAVTPRRYLSTRFPLDRREAMAELLALAAHSVRRVHSRQAHRCEVTDRMLQRP